MRARFAGITLGDGHSLVVLDARGRVLFDEGGERAVRPASVQKLIVASTALALLGANYRFHTLLAAQQGVNASGAIGGDLMLVGSGDPSFRSGDLERGVATLVRSGLRSVGGISIDDTALAGPEINPYWNPADAGEDFHAPTSAVSLDGDTAEFRIYGGTPGQTARVAMLPANAIVHVSGSVETSGDGDNVVIAEYAPNEVALSGEIPARTEEKYWVPIYGVARFDADVLKTMLRRAGVDVGSGLHIASAPLDAVDLWDHRSGSLPKLIKHMLYYSDNHYAEQLLRTIGGDQVSRPDDAGGVEAERIYLQSRGIPIDGLSIVDGSGLAERNRVSAMTLARVLAETDLYRELPQGGRSGTLKDYDFTTALGRVRAKTGHLSDASSLAGYVESQHHGRLVFAFMDDDAGRDAPDDVYVSAVDLLATF